MVAAPPASPDAADRPGIRAGAATGASLTPAAFVNGASQAPAAPGAYLLVIDLAAPLPLPRAGTGAMILPPGTYLYAGSARGPGGLRARLARHFRLDKTPHWHIDRLTMAGILRGAWIFPAAGECAIIAALAGLPHPAAGFGSTDCPTCPSHLLAAACSLAAPGGSGLPPSWQALQAAARRRAL